MADLWTEIVDAVVAVLDELLNIIGTALELILFGEL